MPIKLIQQPTVVEAAGNIPKRIEEFIGVVNSETTALIIAPANEWVQYSTPDEGAEHIAVCLPAFTPGTVHRN